MTIQEKIFLLESIQTGEYPVGVTAQILAGIIVDNQLIGRSPRQGSLFLTVGHTFLHVAAMKGHLPNGTRARDLINAVGPSGYSALHDAVLMGFLPNDTTVVDLINAKMHNGFSALHYVPCAKKYFQGVTVEDLRNTRDDQGCSALHVSARVGNFLMGTTMHDLLDCKDNGGKSAYEQFTKESDFEKIEPVMNATQAASMADIKKIGKILMSRNPAAVAMWMAREMDRLKLLSRS